MGKNKAKLIQCEYPNGVIRCCAVDEETHEKLQDPVYRKKYFNVLPFDEDNSMNECFYSTEDIPEAEYVSYLEIDKELETDDISLPVEASDMQYSKETYSFENIIYNVNATKEVHQQLANDPVFYAEYFKDQQNAMEVVRIQDESADNDKSAAIEIFKWDRSSTKWLLENYSERIYKFRDPKIKKKTLWAEIKSEFEKKGYEGINEDILDRKLRNMKKTYRTIKYNNGKSATGRGRISWEWFDQFEDMFQEDKTVNFGHLITSINETTETLQQPSLLGAQSLEEKLTEGQPSRESHFYPKPLLSTMQSTHTSQHTLVRLSVQCQNSTDSTVNSSSTSCILSYSDSFDSTEESSNSGPGTSHLSPSRISPAECTSTSKRRANERSRSVYSLRHKHLEVEKTRIQEIRKLCEAVEKSNDIQEERNKILQQILLYIPVINNE